MKNTTIVPNRILISIILVLLCITSKAKSKRDTTIIISNIKVDIKYPKDSIKGSILVLPGWNFNQDDICLKSNFCNKFIANGFILIMPNMQKSIYSAKIFKETRSDWYVYPTLTWITDSLLKHLQNNYQL